ncbi:MAG: S8 family serine peptidase [Bacteroidota bacterium]
MKTVNLGNFKMLTSRLRKIGLCIGLLLLGSHLFAQQAIYEQGKLWIHILSDEAKPGTNAWTQNAALNQTLDRYQVRQYFQAMSFAKRPYLRELYEIECNCNEQLLGQELTRKFPHLLNNVEYLPIPQALYDPQDWLWQSYLIYQNTNGDSGIGGLWFIDNIDANDAWDITRGNECVKVAIIDDGFDPNHPDLVGKIDPPYDFYTGNDLPDTDHGTSTSALICGQTTETGGTPPDLAQYASVGFNTKVMAASWGSGLTKAVYASTVLSADILSISYFNSCNPYTSALEAEQEILDNGTLIVAAAGNEKSDGTNHCDNAPLYPYSGVEDDRTVIVSATYKNDEHIYIGDWDGDGIDNEITHNHYPEVDLCAPSYCLLTPVSSAGGTDPWPFYGCWGGTSQSAPIVAATAALCLSVNPCLSNVDLQHILKSTTDPITDEDQFPGLLGTGRVNAHSAVLMAQSYNQIDPITETVTWDTDRCATEDIIVEDGAYLTITARVEFAPNKKLIIKPGGRVRLDGGTLTSLQDVCEDNMWRGVEVWGNEDLSQSGSNQGRIYLVNDALIENAEVGVALKRFDPDCNSVPGYAGGVIQATNSRFENNHVAVEFDPYVWMPSSFPISNNSRFRNCDFLTSRPLNNAALLPHTFVILKGVHKVKFFGNRFKNTAVGNIEYVDVFNELTHRGRGIVANSATFLANAYCTVPMGIGQPCEGEWIFNEFENLEYGILAYGEDGLDAFDVTRANFKNNYIGIRSEGLMIGPSITFCDFELSPLEDNIDTEPLVGIDLEGTTGFEVEENTFEGFTGGLLQTRIGINLVNTSLSFTDNNEIYRNTFDNLDHGILVAGYNGETSESISYGLVLRCNDFGQTTACKSDIALYNNTDINPVQGGYDLISDPAGNRFSHYCTDGLLSDYFLGLGSELVDYYHHLDIVTTPEDACYSSDYLTPIATEYNYAPQACPTNQSSGLIEHVLIDGLVEDGIVFEEVVELVKGTAPKGDPNRLEAFIRDTKNSSIQVRNEMLRVAPQISDAAFKAAFYRNPALNRWHLAQALIANSPLSTTVKNMMRSSGLQAYYDALQRPQPDGMSNERIFAMDLAKYSRKISQARNDLMRYYVLWADDRFYNEIDNISDPNNVGTSRYIRAALQLQRGEYAAAKATLGTCYNDHRCEVLKILIEAKEKDQRCPRFKTNQIAQLKVIAADHATSGYTNARAILLAENDWLYPPDVRIPNTSGSRPRSIETEEAIAIGELQVFPNPAKDQITISLATIAANENVQLMIYDAQGRLMDQIPVRADDSHLVVNTNAYASGLYFCHLYGPKGLTAYQKLLIQR